MLSYAYIGFIFIDYGNGGYVSHGDTEGDGGGGTSPPCTEGRIKISEFGIHFCTTSSRSATAGTEWQEGNCFTVPCAEGAPNVKLLVPSLWKRL